MNEAVLLAGGFGTRLRHVVSDVPKPLAPVAGRPFLEYLLDRLSVQGYTHVVLATGYMHEKVESHFGVSYKGMTLTYAREVEPLGTGGAIVNALQHCVSDRVTVLNGDTLYDIDHTRFCHLADALPSRLTVVARLVADAGRYGALEVDPSTHRITAFREKDPSFGAGLINGGIYRLQRELLADWPVGRPFSFEKEVLQAMAEPMYAWADKSYFIDIGVPDDYARAQVELPLLGRSCLA